MKSFRKELWFKTPHRRDYINITSEVEQALAESGIKEGLALIDAMHITASVYINDAESGLIADYDDWLEKLAPHAPISQYRHNATDKLAISQITVRTSSETGFDDVSGLSGLAAGNIISVRGLLFKTSGGAVLLADTIRLR